MKLIVWSKGQTFQFARMAAGCEYRLQRGEGGFTPVHVLELLADGGKVFAFHETHTSHEKDELGSASQRAEKNLAKLTPIGALSLARLSRILTKVGIARPASRTHMIA